MKARIARPGTLAALLWLLTAPAAAQVGSYTPEKIGVPIGTTEQDLVNGLVGQGFTFKPGGTHDPILVTQEDFAPMHQFSLFVEAGAGSVDIWQANTVVIGVKGQRVTTVGELVVLEDRDAERAYFEIMKEFDERFGRLEGEDELEIDVNEQAAALALQKLLWLGPRRRGFLRKHVAWRNGAELVVLTQRPAGSGWEETGTRLGTRGERLLVLSVIDLCAYPELIVSPRPAAGSCS